MNTSLLNNTGNHSFCNYRPTLYINIYTKVNQIKKALFDKALFFYIKETSYFFNTSFT